MREADAGRNGQSELLNPYPTPQLGIRLREQRNVILWSRCGKAAKLNM